MEKALIILLLIPQILFSQSEKGVNPINQPTKQPTHQTRAVVVGISDYQDPEIPDLRFADRDAEAFAEWLRSGTGLKLQEEQVQLLLNKQATSGNIAAAWTWLIDESKRGDRVILYFSGHGDVEKVSVFQRGYLLAWNTPPQVYMAGGAFEMRVLQDIISTLSQRDVQVIVVTDACRAGKLAGSGFGGPKATAAALATQFANEVKILSCQPDEFSVEGEQWGGGRGAFSYHLVDGLFGLADQNADAAVNLFEIQRYLQDHVAREVAPQSQIPFAVGNPKTLLADVNPTALSELSARKKSEMPVLKTVEHRSLETATLAGVDSSIQQLYAAFNAALKRGDLLTPSGASADDYYRRLIELPEIARLHGAMTRNFAAALVDEAQVMTNKLLKGDPKAMSSVFTRPHDFKHVPSRTARACELLGEQHFLYKHLKAKQLFFEGLDLMPHFESDTSTHDPYAFFKKWEEGLRYDSSAAYILGYMGHHYIWTNPNYERSLFYLNKALELCPNLPWLHQSLGSCLSMFTEDSINLKAVEFHLLKAYELDSSFRRLLTLSAFFNGKKDDPAMTEQYSKMHIQAVRELLLKDSTQLTILDLFEYGIELFGAVYADYKHEALQVFERVELLTDKKMGGVYPFLNALYYQQNQFEKAIQAGEMQIKFFPNNPEGYVQMSMTYQKIGHINKQIEYLEAYLKRIWIPGGSFDLWFHLILADAYRQARLLEKADSTYNLVLKNLPNFSNPFEMNYIAHAYFGLGDTAAMQRTIEAGLKRFPADAMTYYQVGCIYAVAKQTSKSLEFLERAIEMGFRDLSFFKQDLDLDNIRSEQDFNLLLKKHFPEKVKD